jgi:hypothetical protein
MKTVCLLLVGVVTGASALVCAYHIDPKTAAMSGKVSGNPSNGGVTQSVVCCWDTLVRVELLAGAKGNGGVYTATVLDGGTPLVWSTGTQSQNESWVKFENWSSQVAFTKGKLLTIQFTRGGNDSIQYYFQEGNPYPYGELSTTSPHAGQDLAIRCYGHPRVGGQATAV